MSKTKISEQGQALVLIAVGIIGLVGFTALAIDGGNAFFDRRRAQNAADTAAFAGALASARGQNINSAAEGIATQNEYSNSDPNVTVTVTTYSQDEYDPLFDETLTYTFVQVDINSVVDTYFAKVLGINQITNNVTAVARARHSFYTNFAYGNAIVGLSPHDCQAVKYQGNATTELIGGGIFVNSDCASSAYFNNSSAGYLQTPCLTAVGGITYATGSLQITDPSCPGPQSGADQFPPEIFQGPEPACTGNATINGDTMSPGNYTDSVFPPAQVTKLEPGEYCLYGEFRLNANDILEGTDVTFFLMTGGLTWNGGATVNLHAPLSGKNTGFLIVAPYSNTNTLTIAGNNESTFSGTIFAPSSDINFLGTANPGGVQSQIIGWTVELSGNSFNSFAFDDNRTGDAFIQPSIELNE